MIPYLKRYFGFLLSIAVLAIYAQGMREKSSALKEVSLRLEEIREEKKRASCEQEELLLALASQEDPAWIELVLMRDLGVVPEGWLKVHFVK